MQYYYFKFILFGRKVKLIQLKKCPRWIWGSFFSFGAGESGSGAPNNLLFCVHIIGFLIVSAARIELSDALFQLETSLIEHSHCRASGTFCHSLWEIIIIILVLSDVSLVNPFGLVRSFALISSFLNFI